MSLISVNSLEMQYFVNKHDLSIKLMMIMTWFLILSFEYVHRLMVNKQHILLGLFSFPCPPSGMHYISREGQNASFRY